MKDKFVRCHDCNCLTTTLKSDIEKYYPQPVIFCCDKCIKRRQKESEKLWKDINKSIKKPDDSDKFINNCNLTY